MQDRSTENEQLTQNRDPTPLDQGIYHDVHIAVRILIILERLHSKKQFLVSSSKKYIDIYSEISLTF